MRGQVLGVDPRTGDGVVAGDDGRRYAFRPADWARPGEPAIGMLVDFEADDKRALSLFPVPGAAPSPVATPPSGSLDGDRNNIIAAVLAFFLGIFGIHRFYLGRTGSGIVMLVLTCTFLGLVLTVSWSVIDMVRYLLMSDREFGVRYART